jgi:heme-degrading monooxygenase HmoA
MYATIRRYENNPDLADRLAARSDEVKALISGVPGFRAYHLVRSNDGTASVTVCDEQAGAEETNRIAAEWLRENMPDAVSAAPQVTAGEVVIEF